VLATAQAPKPLEVPLAPTHVVSVQKPVDLSSRAIAAAVAACGVEMEKALATLPAGVAPAEVAAWMHANARVRLSHARRRCAHRVRRFSALRLKRTEPGHRRDRRSGRHRLRAHHRSNCRRARPRGGASIFRAWIAHAGAHEGLPHLQKALSKDAFENVHAEVRAINIARVELIARIEKFLPQASPEAAKILTKIRNGLTKNMEPDDFVGALREKCGIGPVWRDGVQMDHGQKVQRFLQAIEEKGLEIGIACKDTPFESSARASSSHRHLAPAAISWGGARDA